MLFSAFGFSQSINFNQLGKEKWLRYNGGIAANGVYYNGDANRQAFTYFLTGNLNFNIEGLYNIPLSFTYSNQEFDFLILKKDRAEIIFTTNPIHQDLFKGWKNGGYYRNPSTRLFEPSGFAKEIKYLRDRGVKIVKFKDGSNLNLDEVDLSEMDWITNWKY